MSHIYVISPAGAVLDKAGFARAVKRLTQAGHQVQVDDAALLRHMRFAGSDEVRVQALARAAQSGADVVLLGRGGYGLTRILPDLPFAAIEQSIAQGCRWIGYSDFTALQLALLARNSKTPSKGLTWAGPLLASDVGAAPQANPLMWDCLMDAMAGVAEGTGWRLPAADRRALEDVQFPTGQGVLWGGNLCMVTALLGTPYIPNIKGGILFFEDVAEPPYRIERMLWQLYSAGVLQKQKAIVLGSFTHYQRSALDKGFDVPVVVQWLRSKLQVPIITGLPFGHIPGKVCLPVGAKAQLLRQGNDALLLWGHD